MASIVSLFTGFEYHPHQESAIRWMMERECEDAAFYRGGLLCDEMGTGKTYTALGLMANVPVANTLLLVPPVLQPQWVEALMKCDIPHTILAPPKAKGAGAHFITKGGSKPFAVTVATYDRATHNAVFLNTVSYDRIVCDEGHVFRNGHGTKRFRILSAIPAARRWILSGTPVQNRKTDFINLLNFLGMDKQTRLKTTLSIIAEATLLRRTVGLIRDTVSTMPQAKPTHIVHPVVMPEDSDEERTFAALVGRFESAIEGRAKSAIILELYLRIRQFISHPAIYVNAMKRKYGVEYGRDSWTGTASKMAAFSRFLSTSIKEPTIVFTTFNEEMELAKTALHAAGYATGCIAGGMSDTTRTAVINESRATVAKGLPTAILVQIVAGGAGLNLQHCNRVVFLSSHWNPAMSDQAVARAYRIGQTKHVTVHHMLLADDAEKNLDRRMAVMHGQKRSVAVAIHKDLFCEAAVDTDRVMNELDAVLYIDIDAEQHRGDLTDDDDEPVESDIDEDADEDPIA